MYQFASNKYSGITFNFSKFQDTVCALKVNETKLTLRNAFILDGFALGGELESKCDGRIFGAS